MRLCGMQTELTHTCRRSLRGRLGVFRFHMLPVDEAAPLPSMSNRRFLPPDIARPLAAPDAGTYEYGRYSSSVIVAVTTPGLA